jgi:hypothetical protein
MLPKIVHKTGYYQNEDCFPDILKQTYDQNKKVNPDYEFRYYNDEDCEQIIHQIFGNKGLHAYRNVLPGAFRADLFRFCVVYLFGGIYSDLAQLFLVPLHDIIDHDTDTVVMTLDHFNYVQINFIAAQAQNKVVFLICQQLMDNIMNHKYPSLLSSGGTVTRSVFGITGPYAVSTSLDTILKNKPDLEKSIRFVFRPCQGYVSSIFTLKNQAHCDYKKKPVILYYNQITKKKRSNTNYVMLYLFGRVYRDYKHPFPPICEIIVITMILILFVALMILGYFRQKCKRTLIY